MSYILHMKVEGFVSGLLVIQPAYSEKQLRSSSRTGSQEEVKVSQSRMVLGLAASSSRNR